MSLRLEFVHEAFQRRTTFAELCARYGISEKTGYKWRARFLAGGPDALHDRSHAPQGPHRMAAEQEELLGAARRAHPTWGARKLRARLLAAHPAMAWPAPSTLTAALDRAGLIVHRPRRARGAHPAFALTPAVAPNDVWSVDFKGEFRTGDGRYCYPLTVMDGASRLLLACQARPHINGAETQASFRRLFQTHGLPRVIRSDNGTPFAGPGLRGLSRLNVWWLRLGITPERIHRGCPQENGGHERMHRTLKAEATRPPSAHCRAQQRRFDAFRREYNQDRPHEALGQVPPSTRYTPSPRPFPPLLPPLEYPAHYETRRVGSNGHFRWHAQSVFLTKSLHGEPIGLERIDETHWLVYFGALLLGQFTPHTNTVIELRDLPSIELRDLPSTRSAVSPIIPV
jgi:transposase InsO family protein